MKRFLRMWNKKLKLTLRIEHRRAARELQRRIREWLLRKKELELKHLEILRGLSALHIQRLWRGFMGRTFAAAVRQNLLEHRSAYVIQKHWRRWMYCKKVQV